MLPRVQAFPLPPPLPRSRSLDLALARSRSCSLARTLSYISLDYVNFMNVPCKIIETMVQERQLGTFLDPRFNYFP